MSGERYIARVPDAAARTIGDELMVMSGKDSSLFSLNETAAVLWEAADGATPLAEIVERHICAEYDVAPEEALRDAEEVVRLLSEHGILLVSEQPIGPP